MSRAIVAAIVLLALLVIAPHASGQPTDPTVEAVKNDLTGRFAKGGRYVIGIETAATPHQHCQRIGTGNALLQNDLVKPYADFADHPDAKLLECDYAITGSTRRGWAIMLAASPANIAARLVGACKAVVPAGVKACLDKLIGHVKPNGTIAGGEAVWRSNNLQFPVTGFIEEGPGPCAQPSGKPGLIGFRHGVTIRYGKGPADPTNLGFCFTEPMTIAVQRDIGLTFRTHLVRNVGRIAALDRSGLPAAEKPPGFGNMTPPGLDPDAWQRVVQVNEIRAIKTGYDRLMILRAAASMGVTPPPPQP